MPIRGVIFDWGGTLTPWHTVVPRDAWAAAVGDDELAARLVAAEDELWARTTSDRRSATLAEVFARAGVPSTEDKLAAFHTWWEPHTRLDPAAPALFDALHARGMRVGVLSNTLWPRERHERIFARDGVLERIDGAIYTSEIAWTKPHPLAFRAALDAIGVDDPADAVFVGDRPYDDISGAKAAGMRAVLVPHSDIPPEQAGPITAAPDAVITGLVELLAVLDAWTAEESGR